MIAKVAVTLILTFFAIDCVEPLKESDIYDTTAVNRFFQSLMEKVERNTYQLKSKTDDDTKNRILKNILSDAVGALEALNTISSDIFEEYWYPPFRMLLKNLQEAEVKGGEVRRSFLPLVSSMEETWTIIDARAKSLISFHESDDSDHLAGLCPLLFGVTRFLEIDYRAQSIATIYKNFIENVLQGFSLENSWKSCGQKSSLREGLFKFFHKVMTSYLKEFVLYWFVNIANARCLDKNSPGMLGKLFGIYLNKFEKNLKITRDTIHFYKFIVYRCDANKFDEYNREWYYELEKMIQTVIVNEKDMSIVKSCSHNCDVCSMKYPINDRDCREFRDCHLIKGHLEVCKTYEKYNSRRFQWFKDSEGVVYGNQSLPCYQKEYLRSYYDGWKLRDCDYCMCTCVKKQEPGYHVVTAISFREQVSNIADNMVVMGVRFVRQDYMIHVQIKEGRLGLTKFNGYDPWKPLEDIGYDESTQKFFIKDGNNTPMQLGLDYWHPESINLDDLVAPLGYAVTGVRFRLAEDSPDHQLKFDSIELQIRVSPMDFLSGRILDDDERTYWISPEHKDQRRTELILSEPDLPTKSTKNLFDSSKGQFVKFQKSDLKKDAGQSTVPFFDAMEVEGAPGFPVGGVGIVHRGKKGFGGYIKPSLDINGSI
ncbi:uncharacterized protein LOC141532239 isoform X2 [Cotesia typhae]|uniref:uncharacterized protein LOC141532239 isoform X2 n=1 Tax=Cotesia typhae TaxID=2053667 RepID=UPI003D68DF14